MSDSNAYEVMRLTPEAYDALRGLAATAPDLWLDPDADFDAILADAGHPDHSEPTGIVGDGDFVMTPATN